MLSQVLILTLTSVATAQQRLFSSAFGYPGYNATFNYVVISRGTSGLLLTSRFAATLALVAVIKTGSVDKVKNENNSTITLY